MLPSFNFYIVFSVVSYMHITYKHMNIHYKVILYLMYQGANISTHIIVCKGDKVASKIYKYKNMKKGNNLSLLLLVGAIGGNALL